MDYILHPQYKDWLLHWTLLARQMRGFFTEPSHFGMYAGVMCAFLWYKIFTEKSRLAIVGNVILSFYVVLTSSRAAVGIYCALLISLFMVIIYKREKNLFKGVSIIFLSAVISFSAGTYFIKTVILPQTVHPRLYITGDMYGYLQSNLGSLTEVNARSNGARYAYAYAALKTGFEHPFLGVGKRFYTLYAIENIPEWSRNNSEVVMRVNKQKKEPLDNLFPVGNWYCELFATRGTLGVVWYLFPFVLAIWKIVKKFKVSAGDIEHECILFFELLVVVALWGINDSAPSLFYTNWTLLAVAYLLLTNSGCVQEN